MFSIVVCTWNRADLLAVCLETLAAQEFDREAFEVLVIDNNSSDRTAEVAAGFGSRHVNFRYVFEPAQGLSHARNCGWRAAVGRFIAYVDDECKVPPTWLTHASRLVSQHQAAMFGGPYCPWYATPKPRWFKESYESTLWKGGQAKDLSADQFLDGGNMFIRRDVLEALSGFDPSFGMKGGSLAYGEETVFQNRLREAFPGAVIRYDPALVLAHMVRPEKMTLSHSLRARIAGGISSARTSQPELLGLGMRLRGAARAAHRLIICVALGAWHASIGIILRDRDVAPFPENHVYEVVLPQIQNAAAYLVRLGQFLRLGKAAP